MKKNMSELDKILRVLAAAVVVVLNFMGTIGGTVATVLMSLAAVLLLTTLINFCPLYALFKISTRKKE
ncbi:MAG: DUF2892 domain-containing protein [Bacteroidia bacterium]|nr:DUF2892 domain-containing protein [Bacteroidia bacterium]